MKTKSVKKPKKNLKPVKTREELSLLNLKVNEKDRKALRSKSLRYAKGNLSAWLRHAGLHYKPSKTERI